MDDLGIGMAVLSLPSISTGSIGVENRAWAREQNLYAASICAEYPSRFAFFAHLPFLDDVQGMNLPSPARG
jgi:6-methylsalicylate decarboxylase